MVFQPKHAIITQSLRFGFWGFFIGNTKMLATSPVIKDGDFQLSDTGDLLNDYTIVTQMNSTIVGNQCYYADTFQSTLLEYLQSPSGATAQLRQQTVTNIVKNAYQILIQQGYISDLEIFILALLSNYLTIKTTAVDTQQNQASTTWSNS